MRLCLAATTGFDRLITIAASEPLLAEAASQLMHESQTSPVRHLANHSDLNCVDHGWRGELVAALIIMQARDAASRNEERWVSVCDFMEALLLPAKYKELRDSEPTFWRESEDRTFSETFQDYAMWFNHVIRIEDGNMISTELLWRFITRGAMIMCRHNQTGIDIVLPVCARQGKLSGDSVTAIIIQVKNAKQHGNNIDKTVFDEMDPFEVGLFNPTSQKQKPVIRMVFALASPTHDTLFPPRRTNTTRCSGGATKFTAWDIWCAGLMSFKNIGGDLASYERLLVRSMISHDAFDVGEKNDIHLDDETWKEIGRRRRTMAALIMSNDNYSRIHL